MFSVIMDGVNYVDFCLLQTPTPKRPSSILCFDRREIFTFESCTARQNLRLRGPVKAFSCYFCIVNFS